ncbi:MAG: hypothetical protein KDA99_08265, partial [Planctomycetales bacterium]|nr:hypothetical protein [Planctomycetales bacterium]
MTARRSSKRTLHNSLGKALGRRRRQRPSAAQHSARTTLQMESLETRNLLAVGPQLIAITPNNGLPYSNGEVRNIAPRELTFQFNDGQTIDADTLGAIQITRSNFDGVFGDGDDITVTPGYIDVADTGNEVIVRFAENLPDDVYQIQILGAGSNALRNTRSERYNV